METLARGLRAIRYTWWAVRSWLLISWYRALYPGLQVGRRVHLGRAVYLNVVKGCSIRLEEGVHVDSFVHLTAEGDLRIGANSYIGMGTVIVASERITIGANALIAAFCTIRDQDHGGAVAGMPFNAQALSTAAVSLGNNVWLGTKATVLKGVSIGDNSIVGANAVVTRSVPANSTAVGVPARVTQSSNAGVRDVAAHRRQLGDF